VVSNQRFIRYENTIRVVSEVVQKYVYLGQTLQLGRNNFEHEVNRRIQLGWAAFGKLRRFFSSSIPDPTKLKDESLQLSTKTGLAHTGLFQRGHLSGE
jgi:hypothetical protein